jgi:hypothetical protein
MHYNTREALLELDEVRRFVDWMKGKPGNFVPK